MLSRVQSHRPYPQKKKQATPNAKSGQSALVQNFPFVVVAVEKRDTLRNGKVDLLFFQQCIIVLFELQLENCVRRQPKYVEAVAECLELSATVLVSR